LLTVALVAPPELDGERTSGVPQYGLASNSIGVDPVVLASIVSWVLKGGTGYCGTLSLKVTGNVPDVLVAD
jgi:hypothetical protein